MIDMDLNHLDCYDIDIHINVYIDTDMNFYTNTAWTRS